MSEIGDLRRLVRHFDAEDSAPRVATARAADGPTPSPDDLRRDELTRLAREYGVDASMDRASIRRVLAAHLEARGAPVASRHPNSVWMDPVFELLAGRDQDGTQRVLHAVRSYLAWKRGDEFEAFTASDRTRAECVDELHVLLDRVSYDEIRAALEAARQLLERNA